MKNNKCVEMFLRIIKLLTDFQTYYKRKTKQNIIAARKNSRIE